MNELRVFERISDAVGWTPLVRLNRSVAGLDCEVFAKIEYMNPMGSVKDRIARFMVERAMADGRLVVGDTVIENSSGNTAMGLAMMSVLHDLRCTMVVRRQTSKEKLDCLRAMGINLVLSLWLCESINPGQTILAVASMTRCGTTMPSTLKRSPRIRACPSAAYAIGLKSS